MYYKMIKRRILSIIAALVFLLSVSGCATEEKEGVYMNISPEKAKEMMKNSEEFILLDVRSEEEFAEGHIPGAVVLPHDEIYERAEKELSQKDIPLFVYCRSGNRSKIASEALIELGYSEIYEFGGIIDWPYEIEK